MGEPNFCGYLISQFYPTRKIHKNLMRVKMCFAVCCYIDILYADWAKKLHPFFIPNHLVRSQSVIIILQIYSVWN